MHELIPPTVNFVLVIALLTYLTRKPIKEMIRTRQATIRTQVDEAAAQKAEAEKKYREFNDRLNAFETEAQQVIDRARLDGEALKDKIIKDARASAERIIKESEATVSASIQEFKDHLRRDTISKAVELAERIIRDGLSHDDQRRIVNEYVGKVQQQ